MSSVHEPDRVVASRLRDPAYRTIDCKLCNARLEYLHPGHDDKDSAISPGFMIKCAGCTKLFQAEHANFDSKASASPSKRRYGTDQKPLETVYYDLLNVSPTATQDEIKKGYRKLALILHPDKTAGNAAAEECFKSIGVAYQVLSDPKLRHKYNEYGAKKEVSPEGGFSDPEELFAQLFGGERFEDIIGTIAIGKDMADALKQAPNSSQSEEASKESIAESTLTESEKKQKEESERAKMDERDKVRADRVLKLSEALERRLDEFVRSQQSAEAVRAFQEKHSKEADELKTEPYGVEILQAVGFTYIAKSRAYLSRTTSYFGGLTSMWYGVKGTVHVLSETVGTLRSAMELKNHFERIEKEEKEGRLTEERRKALEEEAAEKGMRALWLGAKLEVESVTREVCDAILQSIGENVVIHGKELSGDEILHARALGLTILGTIYSSVSKEEGTPEISKAGSV